ncbi:MAG: HAD family hydrolase [Bullifex sp.]
MTKYIFFDVDGTLLPFGEDATESTKRALRIAHANGHRLFLSTGRSPAELDPRLSVFDFDGGVYAGGSVAIAEGERIYERFFSREQVEEVFSLARDNGWLLLIQTDTGSYMTPEMRDTLYAMFMASLGRLLVIENLFTEEKLTFRSNITKMILITSKHDIKEIRERLKGRYDIVDNTMGVPLDDCAEIVLPGVSKATGLHAVMEYYGAPLSDSVAFGDGANDIEIVSASGFGVAMGNASDELKKAADYVTGDVKENGIYDALEYLGVLN